MKIQIEMEVPDGMDPSTVLERMQEVALEFAEQYGEEQDEESDDFVEGAFVLTCGEPWTRDQIEAEVSVQTGN